ncbi:MAG: hypothetical protein OXF46_04570 [Rhodobacteraceae bacterium]|nr:hypothetical protein [Paracoccaceae bacterium]
MTLPKYSFSFLRLTIVLVISSIISFPVFPNDFSWGLYYVEKETLDDFDGCDYGKIIQFQSGDYVKCNGYEYFFGYYSDVTLFFSSPYMIDGRIYADCPMLVDDEFIEVDCSDYVEKRIRFWIRCIEDESGEEDFRNYCFRMLNNFLPIDITPEDGN